MRALVVYESMFGNTEAVAHAVADGLSTRADVAVVRVAGLFLAFPTGLVVGVVGALGWVVWRHDEGMAALPRTTARRRPAGMEGHRLPSSGGTPSGVDGTSHP